MDRINRMVLPQADQNKEVKNNVCTYKCAYHRDTQWWLPGDMPDMAPDSGFDSYSRCTDLEFHPVYEQKIEPRKRGCSLTGISRRSVKCLRREMHHLFHRGTIYFVKIWEGLIRQTCLTRGKALSCQPAQR